MSVNQSASELLQLIPKPFPGKVVVAGSENAAQSANQFPSPRRLLHFNYAFKAVNSESFVSSGIFFFFILLFYLMAFLTGSLLGTFF